MKPWHVDAAVIVALALLVFLVVAPSFGLEVPAPNPLVVAGFGALIGFAFTRRDKITRKPKDDDDDGDGEQ